MRVVRLVAASLPCPGSGRRPGPSWLDLFILMKKCRINLKRNSFTVLLIVDVTVKRRRNYPRERERVEKKDNTV